MSLSKVICSRQGRGTVLIVSYYGDHAQVEKVVNFIEDAEGDELTET